MNLDEQRKLGIRLAEEARAPKTRAAIEDPNSCFADIFKSAVAEVGVDGLVEYIQKGDPTWAYKALRLVPDLGDGREALIKKTAEQPESAIHTLRFVDDLGGHAELLRNAAAGLVDALNINEFELHAEGTAYAAYFTMHWVNNGTPYSYETYVSEWVKNSCSYFAGWPGFDASGDNRQGLPISVGDQVWISVHAAGGETVASPLRFTWIGDNLGSNGFLVGKFVASGSVQSVNLDYGGIF